MILTGIWSEWTIARYRMLHWRMNLAVSRKLALCLGMACLTGLLAQVRLPLPFTPVPITGQVFAVLLAGVLLGKHFGALSQVFYVGLGAAGLPWFSGWSSSALSGLTGGYLIGFIVAAGLAGGLTDGHLRLRGLAGQVLLMTAGILVIYLFGAVQFAIMMRTGLKATLNMAVLPFIPLGIVKALAAALVTTAILPKSGENPEQENGSRAA